MAHSCTLTDCSCAPCNCNNRPCQNACSTLARIERRVRMPMTLFTSRQSAFNISGFDSNSHAASQSPRASDPFSGPSDRASRSLNTITGKRGVDKKHNSYARYLGRRKAPILRADMEYGAAVGGCGNHICCCECQQTIRIIGSPQVQGNPLDNAQVGDIVTQTGSGASGVIIAIERFGGDLDRIIVKLDDCAKLFIGGLQDTIHAVTINGMVPIDHQGVVVTTDTCGKVR